MTRKRERERQPDGKLTDEERRFIEDNLRLAGVVEPAKSKVAKAKTKRPKRRRTPAGSPPDPSTWYVLAATYSLLGTTLARRGHAAFGYVLIGFAVVILALAFHLTRKRGGRS